MEPYWEVAVTVAPQSLTLLTLLKGHTLHTHHPNGTLMEPEWNSMSPAGTLSPS